MTPISSTEFLFHYNCLTGMDLKGCTVIIDSPIFEVLCSNKVLVSSTTDGLVVYIVESY